MNESLRNRIAAAVRTDHTVIVSTATAARLADAVITELQLEQELGCATAGHHGCRCSNRYVTSWKDNNDQ